MIDGITEKINFDFGNFKSFLMSSIREKKQLLESFRWSWVRKNSEVVDQVGWSHHRILKVWDLIYILNTIRGILFKFGSFFEFGEAIYEQSESFPNFITTFVNSFKGDPHLFGGGKITSQKCFKRYLLFFRWVVGKDPDLRLWKFIPLSELMVPIDVSVKRVLARLGLLDRESGCKWKDVIDSGEFYLLINSENKLWIDFWLSRLGLLRICNSKKQESKCDICPLEQFCISY
jgi:uncharacterized protein (TIGR02757 family)